MKLIISHASTCLIKLRHFYITPPESLVILRGCRWRRRGRRWHGLAVLFFHYYGVILQKYTPAYSRGEQEVDPGMLSPDFLYVNAGDYRVVASVSRPFAVGAVGAEVVEAAAGFPGFVMPRGCRDDVSLRCGDSKEVFALILNDADDRDVGAAAVQGRFDCFVFTRRVRREAGYAGRLFVGGIGLGAPDAVGLFFRDEDHGLLPLLLPDFRDFRQEKQVGSPWGRWGGVIGVGDARELLSGRDV